MLITNIYLIAAVAVTGGALFGFDVASLSALLGTQQYRCYFNQGPDGRGFNDSPFCSGPTASTQGGITAAMSGGSFVGSIASGFFTDVVGRRKSISYGSIFWMIGCILMSASQNIGMLIASRFINGLAVGIISAQFPVYMSELARPSHRGMIVGCQQWAITWGILIMYYIGYGCSYIQGNLSFRLAWGLMITPAFIIFAALFFLPESPRWLASKGRYDEAHEILALVHAQGNREDAFVQAEVLEIKQTIELETHGSDTSYLALLKPDMIWRTSIGVFTMIWCQLTGINVIMYYIVFVFAMAGIDGNTGLIAGSISYVINVVTTIPILLLMDRVGRRKPFIIGGLALATWWFASAGLMAVYGHPAPEGGLNGISVQSWVISGPASKAVIACSFLVVASYASLVGPITWVYPPELFPLRVRGKAVSVSMGSMWLTNFAVTYFIPPAFQNINWKTYIIFGCTNFAMAVHVFLAFPETAGKTLEEVETIFKSGVPAWKTKTDRKRIVAWEHGHVDTEQVANALHQKIPVVRTEETIESKDGVQQLENVSR